MLQVVVERKSSRKHLEPCIAMHHPSYFGLGKVGVVHAKRVKVKFSGTTVARKSALSSVPVVVVVVVAAAPGRCSGSLRFHRPLLLTVESKLAAEKVHAEDACE